MPNFSALEVLIKAQALRLGAKRMRECLRFSFFPALRGRGGKVFALFSARPHSRRTQGSSQVKGAMLLVAANPRPTSGMFFEGSAQAMPVG